MMYALTIDFVPSSEKDSQHGTSPGKGSIRKHNRTSLSFFSKLFHRSCEWFVYYENQNKYENKNEFMSNNVINVDYNQHVQVVGIRLS